MRALGFSMLGLFGEVGSLLSEVKKKQRDAASYLGYADAVAEELGDVLWYLSAIARRSRLSLADIAAAATGDGVWSPGGNDALTFHALQPKHMPLAKAPTVEFEDTLAQYDLHAWKKVGPGIQRLIVDRFAGMEDASLVDAAGTATIMLKETLSSTVTGTSWKADAMLLHNGSVVVTDELKQIRRDALGQLERLHGLLADDGPKGNVQHAMLAAGSTPNNAGYTDQLGEVIMDDLARVMGFFAGVIPGLGLEARRHLEVAVHQRYYTYHALLPAMAGNAALAAAQGGCSRRSPKSAPR